MPIDQRDDAETLRGGGQGGDIAVLEGTDREAARGSRQEAVEQGVGGAQVEQGDGAGLAVDTAGLDDAPIAASLDDVPLEAGHLICVYNTPATKSSENDFTETIGRYGNPALSSAVIYLELVLCIR
jgi:hypothetical protein